MASAVGNGAAETASPSSPSAEPWDLQSPRAMPCWLHSMGWRQRGSLWCLLHC